MDFIIGLDLGQASDPTALCILRRAMVLTAEGLPTRDHRDQMRYRFDCVILERYPLGTSYPDVVTKVKNVVDHPKLTQRPRLAIDATGVGRAVVDMFLDAHLNADIFPVTLTAGKEINRERWNQSASIGFWTPKNEVVGGTQALLQTGRLKIAKGLRLADTLKQELLNFRMKITAAANETFNAREGKHDDILFGGRHRWLAGDAPEIEYLASDPDDPGLVAMSAEQEAEALALRREVEAEEEALRREWLDPDNPIWWT